MDNVITKETPLYADLMARIQAMDSELDDLLKGGIPQHGRWIEGKEVCKLLHICPRTLQYYRDNGTLPYSTACGKLHYNRGDIEALLRKNYVEAW